MPDIDKIQVGSIAYNLRDASSYDYIDELRGSFKKAYATSDTTGAFRQGTINSETGGISGNVSNRICSNGYISPGICLDIMLPENYKCYVHKYQTKNYTSYLGNHGMWETGTVSLFGDYYYKIVLAYMDNSDIEPEAGEDVVFRYYMPDATLSKSGVVADAHAVGTAIGITADPEGNDQTTEIQNCLANNGYCKLGKGIFYTSGITMPEGSKLEGSGMGTIIRLMDVSTTYDMGEPRSSSSGIGYRSAYSINSDPAIPLGLYTVSVNISTEYNEASSRVHFFGAAQYSASNEIAYKDIPRDETYVFQIYLPKAPKSIYVTSGTSSSSGVSLTINSFSLVKDEVAIVMQKNCIINNLCVSGSESNITRSSTLGHRNGIGWFLPDNQYGIVDGCQISNFDCGGILLQDTSTPTDHGLAISNCHIHHNNVGIYLRRDAEYNKISNCIVTWNYYGMINRGGNNIVTGCGFDRNAIGIQVDQDEGGNNGHGSISNCTINHTSGTNNNGLIIRDTGRMLVSNCNLYYSNVLIQNSNGNTINGCGFGNSAAINITGGGCNIIIGCIMKVTSNAVTLSPNDNPSQVINCYTREGVLITPTV